MQTKLRCSADVLTLFQMEKKERKGFAASQVCVVHVVC